MSARSHENEHGFTLVEVLIALFIFSLISVGATSALTASLRGQNQMEERLEEISSLETMRGILRGDMANLHFRQVRDAYGGNEPYVLRADQQDLLLFTRSGRSNPLGDPRGDLQRVSYHFENGNFIRRSFAQVDPAPQSGYTDRILLSGLSRVNIGFERFVATLGITSTLDNVRLEAGQSADFLNALKVEIEYETGETLTQFFEVKS